MLALLEILPVIIFGVVYFLNGKTLDFAGIHYQFNGIYRATAALMAATVLVFVASWFWKRTLTKGQLGMLAMVLVLGGCGTAVLATGAFPSDADGAGLSVGVLGVALAFGLTVLTMAYAIGPISGCHINPAVTLGMVIAKKTKAGMIPIYWSAQIAGGIVGALFIKIIASGAPNWKMPGEVAGGFATNGYGKLSPGGFSLGAVGFAEVLFTALFVLVVIHTTRKDFAAGFGGIAAGLMLTLVHLISIPVSNTSVNPARSFGVAIIKGGDALSSQVWAFVVFPLLGAIIAGIIAVYVLPEPKKIESASAGHIS